MRHRYRMGATALLVVLSWGLLQPGSALAHSEVAHPGVPLVAQQPERPQTLARIELTDMSPRVVTPASAPVLRVSGRITNVGDRPITKLGVRLQRDDPVTSDETASRAIRGVPSAPHWTRFSPLPGDLAPGQSIPFQLEVPLRGGADLESLQINEPGVYPLLVNLNGKPDYGDTARLAVVPILLPVLGTPPDVPGAPPGPALPPPPQPTPLTVVWPLAAEPARLPTAPDKQILLEGDGSGAGDPVATQIAPGGRLDGLVGALEQAVPPGSPLAAAVCVAVDPLLLETIDGMSHGYGVAHPGGVTPGTGSKNAQTWLDRLRRVVQGRCVLALPYADPDLVAMSRAGLTDLEALATSTGVGLVRNLLGVQPLNGVSWPAAGVLDGRTLSDLTALQTHAVLLEPRGVSPQPQTGNVVGLATGAPVPGSAVPTGLLVDPLLAGALDPNALVDEPEPQQPSDTGTTVAARPTDTAGALAAQDGLGALIYRAAIDPGRQPILLVPPRRWQAGGLEATALLRTARGLLDTGFLAPRELAGMADSHPTGPAVAVDYPRPARNTELPPAVTAEVAAARDMLRDLQGATVPDAATDLKPADLLDPLRLGLLRGMSSAWDDRPDRAAQVTNTVRDDLNLIRQAVRIVPPAGAYTLAASDSPLLITVSNELPVGVQVQLTLSEIAGLRSGAVGLQLIPARSTRQLVIPAEVTRPGQFSIAARLSTPSGTPLGSPSTLQLRSTAFGATTITLTAGAAVVLIVLVTRRIMRRARQARNTG